jgi:hypothetical protein
MIKMLNYFKNVVNLMADHWLLRYPWTKFIEEFTDVSKFVDRNLNSVYAHDIFVGRVLLHIRLIFKLSLPSTVWCSCIKNKREKPTEIHLKICG